MNLIVYNESIQNFQKIFLELFIRISKTNNTTTFVWARTIREKMI